jgi:hypothetical protein
MSRCELALEEDALITSEQLEPQGTLWTLKKKAQTMDQNTRGKLAEKIIVQTCAKLKKMHKKEWEYNHFPFTH